MTILLLFGQAFEIISLGWIMYDLVVVLVTVYLIIMFAGNFDFNKILYSNPFRQ